MASMLMLEELRLSIVAHSERRFLVRRRQFQVNEQGIGAGQHWLSD